MTDFDNTEKQVEISTFVMNYYKLRSFIYDKSIQILYTRTLCPLK